MTTPEPIKSRTRRATERKAPRGAPPRLRRSAPLRSEPDRSPANAFRGASRSSSSSASPASAGPSTDAARRAVEAAVGAAYRVYNDYVDWGQQAAAQRSQSRDWREFMRPNPPDMSQAATQWAQMWQDMLRMWMGYMMPMMPVMPGVPPFGASRSRLQGGELNVELDTSQRVVVEMHLTQASTNGAFKARLHREEGDGQLSLEFDSSKMRITVPPGQAPGTYSGIVRDGSGNQCGMLTVTVVAPAAKGA